MRLGFRNVEMQEKEEHCSAIAHLAHLLKLEMVLSLAVQDHFHIVTINLAFVFCARDVEEISRSRFLEKNDSMAWIS